MVIAERNSLDLIRLIASILVLYSHQFSLLANPEPSLFGQINVGRLGVIIFFFLSGMLIWQSWLRDPNLKRFFLRRSLRIFPALWVVIFCSIFLIGPYFSTLPISDFFYSSITWHYLSNLVLVINHYLPGVFVDNPFPKAVNGSLWTLPLEFCCYALTALFGTIKLLPKNLILSFIFTLLLLLQAFIPRIFGNYFLPHLNMIFIFLCGALYTKTQQKFINKSIYLDVILLIMYTINMELEFIYSLAFTFLIIYFGLHCNYGYKITSVIGDLSYGVYIFAFPIQQIIIQSGHDKNWCFWQFFTLSFLATLCTSFLSWHFIEKPLLKFKPK
jgi:peptidoglycan/LPS O-acetylase OafA/YrhL